MGANINDVAAFVLRECGRMSTMKLQKLTYYAQSWTLVRLGRQLFADDFQAWVEGPVCPVVYAHHRGQFHVSAWPTGSADALSDEEQDCVRRVLRAYSSKSGRWLSDLTHREAPWVEARAGLAPDDRSRRPITKDAMKKYYAGADSMEARIVKGSANPVLDFLDTMNDDEAALVETMVERDLLDPIDGNE